MDIVVLGSGGCSNCENLKKSVESLVSELGLDATVRKVTDIAEAMSFGVMAFPALVVDGELKVSGRIPGRDEIEGYLRG